MLVAIQSISDIITNSSSEIFQFANNKKGVKELITLILKASSSDLTCDDLFIVESHYDIDIIELEDEYFSFADLYKDENKIKKIIKTTEGKDRYSYEYEQSLFNLYNYLKVTYNVADIDELAETQIKEEKSFSNCIYKIIAKDPNNKDLAIKIGNILNNLFDYESYYC